ncbi:MAG: hypothetical protein H6577_11780 [Lewinellaceae bacterium]|nr:hypothetical protein [Saprospiraceae bacterium]MCB9338797.1 hypothetical protein [Lewinellaceae bacterium]
MKRYLLSAAKGRVLGAALCCAACCMGCPKSDRTGPSKGEAQAEPLEGGGSTLPPSGQEVHNDTHYVPILVPDQRLLDSLKQVDDGK